MKLDALQLQQALDDMFAWAMPKLRDEVTDEDSTCKPLPGRNEWRRAMIHINAEIMIEYSDGKYSCYVSGGAGRKSVFNVEGISMQCEDIQRPLKKWESISRAGLRSAGFSLDLSASPRRETPRPRRRR